MDGEQFSLCWNNFHTNLSSGFHALLKDEDLVDVTLAAEGRYLKAHKTVLSVCSPFFKELFRVNPCKHPIVVLQDVNYAALCSLLQFMYQGEVSVSQEEIPTFMRVAETLKVKGLTDNNSSAPPQSNGVERKPFGMTESNSLIKRPRPVKKIIKPIQPLRPIESPKPVRSPQYQPQSSSQPPLKKIHLEEQQQVNQPHSPSLQSSNQLQKPQPQSKPPTPQPSPQTQSQSDFPLLTPKLEPMDPLDVNSDNLDEQISMAMLDTKMEEPSPSSQSSSSGMKQEMKNFWKYEKEQDVSSPGMILLRSGRGQLVLIYFGHIYTLSESKDNRKVWICVKKNTFNCEGRITTLNGPVLVSYSSHNHPQLHDVIQRLQAPSVSISPELT